MGTRLAISSWALVVVSLSLGIAARAAAQEQTGSLEGVVHDEQGGVLPGVTLEVKNVAVGAPIMVATDAQGVFRLSALGPGVYDVTAALAGFATSRFERVEVLLGQIKHLDFALALAAFSETVEVSAASPLVDVKQSARGSSLRHEQLESLPRGIDYTSVVQLLSGANVEPKLGGISIEGASAAENRFVVDGIDTSNPVNGLSTPAIVPVGTTIVPAGQIAVLNVDSVDEIQVKSTGYAAEYGGTTGGVVNVLTKSGTNEWHGDGRFYLGGDALDAAPRPQLGRKLDVVNQAEYFTYPEDPYITTQPGFSLGGPIRRDSAWFFVGYQAVLTHTERTVTFALDQSTTTKSQDITQHLLTASQTLQLGARLRSRVSLNAAPARVEGTLPAQAGTDSPDSNFDGIATLPNTTMSGSVDLLATPKLFVSGRVGYTYSNNHSDNIRGVPRYWFVVTNIGLLDIPPTLERVTGYQTDTLNYEWVKDRLSRLATQVDATWYVRGWGEHAVKGGLQADWTTHDTNKGLKGNTVNLNWDRAFRGRRGKYGFYVVGSNPLDPRRAQITYGTAAGSTAGLFVQDAWRVTSRLTINAGIRSELEHMPAYTTDGSDAPPILTFHLRDKIAPRLGAAYDLLGDGDWKLYGSWGVYYDIFKYALSQGSGAWYSSSYRYTLDTYDWPHLLDNPACPPACPGTLLMSSTTAAAEIPFDPSLDAMRSHEAAVGLEHQWGPNLTIGARYVHKQLDRAVEDIGALDEANNEVYTVGNPGYGIATFAYPGVRLPKAVRDYDAFEVSARRPLAKRWALSATYTWSRLFGNYSGLSQSDENGRVDPNVGRVFDNAFVMFDEKARPVLGPLATDRTHQFKGVLVYTTPFRLTAGLYQYVASGLPVTREVAILQGSFFPLMYGGRLSDGRTPAFRETDLYVQQELGAWRNSRISLGLSVMNLFNQDAAISKFITETEAGRALDISEDAFFAGQVDVNASFEQQGVNRDARFLMDDGYQAPRSARILLKWTF